MMGCASGDIFLPGRIRKGVETHKKFSNFDLFACNGIVISDNGDTIRESFFIGTETTDYSQIVKYQNLDYKKAINIAFGGFGISYNKRLLKPIGYQFPETLLYEDGYMSFLASIQNGAVVIKEPLIKYRRAITSLSRIDPKLNRMQILIQENKFLKLFLSLEEAKHDFIKNNPNINSTIKSQKSKALNYLKQKIVILKLKIDTTESLFIWKNWFTLLFLITKIGVERKKVLKVLILYCYRKKFRELIIREYKIRGTKL